MIQFDDAKKQVESLFGTIRGYKGIYKSFINLENNLSLFPIGANYVFVGTLQMSCDIGSQNAIAYADINGEYSFLFVRGNDNNNNIIASTNQKVEFMGMDLDFGNGLTLLDFSSTQNRGLITIYGWVFQIDK
jgi:hypothetical protein